MHYPDVLCIFEEVLMYYSDNPSAVRSRREITGALLKLMERYPYREISVKQIIFETDLVRRTFYRNFDSKDDVLNAVIDGVIREYTDELTDSQDDPLVVIFDFADRNRKLLELLHRNGMLYLLLLRLDQVIPMISRQTDDRNPFMRLMKGLDPDYIIAFNIGAIWNIIFKWVDRGMIDPPDKVRDTISEYIMRLA